MGRRKWKGDEADLLPSQQIEPYRLWFEFLKLALQDPTLTVNTGLYEPWGSVPEMSFKGWWPNHWRHLFAVSTGVRLITPSSLDAFFSDNQLLVQIPLYQDPKHSLSQIGEFLKERGASDRLKDMANGQFRLQVDDGSDLVHPSTRFLRNLAKVRLLLNIYRFWISHEGTPDSLRLEKTTLSFFRWADGWNRTVKEKQWKRSPIEVPAAVSAYVRYLEERGSRKRLPLYEAKEGDSSDNRRQIARYVRKARKLAANVAEGRFPGAYE